MTCPMTCNCPMNVCRHWEMKKKPGRQRRKAAALRKYNEMQKQNKKHVDGRGWERVLRSQLDAQARHEARAEEKYRRMDFAA